MTKKLLLHHCCVVCTPKVLESFRQEFDELVGYWFNPNIYPLEEYTKRLDALKNFAKQENYQLILNEEISNENWLKELKKVSNEQEPERCKFCYNFRLRQTAQKAKELNISSFSTTLLASPYQKHELVKEIGEKISTEFSIEFVYRDFRPKFYEGKNKIKQLKLYIQKYCGCQFSIPASGSYGRGGRG